MINKFIIYQKKMPSLRNDNVLDVSINDKNCELNMFYLTIVLFIINFVNI